MSAELSFEFVRNGEATALRCVRQDPPWKVVRGFPSETGENLVHLNNVSGGIFGGDALKMSVRVGPGAEAQITTTGATRIYRPLPQAMDASLMSEFHVGQGAVLEYLPDALIPFRQARVVQRTSYFLEEDASLFYWETVAPGRAAARELFGYERLRLSTEINVSGTPILNDRLLLEPMKFPPSSRSILGPYAYLVTFVALRVGTSTAETRRLKDGLEGIIYDQVPDDGRESYWGVTTLPAHGVLVRGLLHSPVTIPATLQQLWSVGKKQLCGRIPIAPRKTY
jgi:urease accessory protein